jgi:predicted transcriptional regulator
LQQAAVAETVGISPSYLNLIEHNKRRIGGKLLSDLARVLDVDTALLAEGVDRETLDDMRAAAATLEGKVEVDRTEELAARYPGWAGLIAKQAQKVVALEEQSRALTDRMSSDPKLAESLHEVISAVSAIHSSASILVGPEDLDQDWQRRFHENIHTDSVRLAQSSEALIAYLEAPQTSLAQAGSPFEVAEAYLAQSGFHIEAMENGIAPAAILKDAGLEGASATVLSELLQSYVSDVALLPLAGFEASCRKHGYDPAAISFEYGVPLSRVLRRMAQLPLSNGHPPIGLAVCDGAGAITFLKSVPGFTMPRSGGACPLWPIFGALSRPNQPIRMDVALPAPNATRFLCYAVAEPSGPSGFDAPSAMQSIMLVMPDPPEPATTPYPVGLSCRICPRHDCASRREPALTGMSQKSEL